MDKYAEHDQQLMISQPLMTFYHDM